MKEFIKIHQNDNVAVALTPLSANRTLDVDGTEVTLREDIPQGHKFALTDIPADAQVIKYGCPIGIAKENISCGSWIHTHNIRTGLGDLLTYTYDRSVTELTPTAPRTFRGYRRPNGKVGIRNEIWIIPTVGCVNNVATAIERKAQKYVQGSVEAVKQSMLKLSNEEVEVKVTFPEEYHAENLQGKDAVFKCTVHEIKEKELPEIDDEFAAEVSEFDTLEEYKADVKAKIKEQKAADGKRNQEDQAVEQAVKNAEYEIPQPMIETQTTQMVEDFAQRIQSQGITLEQYFQFTGLTAEKMMEDMRPQAIKRIETRLVLEAVAKAENIEITDEKIDEELAKMAESYNMEVEKLKEFMGENEKKQMKEDLAVQEAVTFLVENAVEK